MPLPTLRLPPHGSQRTARGETWFGYSFVPGDLHPLPSASSPGAPEHREQPDQPLSSSQSCLLGPTARFQDLVKDLDLPAHSIPLQLLHGISVANGGVGAEDRILAHDIRFDV